MNQSHSTSYNNLFLTAPSFYAHIINGVLLLAAIVYAFIHSSKLMVMDSHHTLFMILLFGIAIGVHGLSHLGLENSYGFNPLRLLRGNV